MILDTVTHVPVNSLLWPSLEIISFRCGGKEFWRVVAPDLSPWVPIALFFWTEISSFQQEFSAVTNRVEEAAILLGEYLLFSYLKFNYTNTQIFTCWMNEIWSMKSTECINHGIERTDLFLRQNWGRSYLFQKDRKKWGGLTLDRNKLVI